MQNIFILHVEFTLHTYFSYSCPDASQLPFTLIGATFHFWCSQIGLEDTSNSERKAFLQ